ncbi:uncharacterized protein BJ171DRAFT_92131 [Polychytrium aggregatum]|uniref:uncharacterized protein n=1 Tax=Polychytrium aggregatum TaxID=110093 RepID=UPI0022FF1CF7|nr:uncharacterized protein BJ171DRAFT_92131 [Polychytrium aggregatum]KAI9204945.1 hypothetical protein BJ171DRAFT_92131 [Polychytrium aggregatum]
MSAEIDHAASIAAAAEQPTLDHSQAPAAAEPAAVSTESAATEAASESHDASAAGKRVLAEVAEVSVDSPKRRRGHSAKSDGDETTANGSSLPKSTKSPRSKAPKTPSRAPSRRSERLLRSASKNNLENGHGAEAYEHVAESHESSKMTVDDAAPVATEAPLAASAAVADSSAPASEAPSADAVAAEVVPAEAASVTAKPAAEPAVESAVKPVVEPAIVEPAAEPAVEPAIVESVVESVAEAPTANVPTDKPEGASA